LSLASMSALSTLRTVAQELAPPLLFGIAALSWTVPLSDHPSQAPRVASAPHLRARRSTYNPHSVLTIPRVRSIRLQ
jgi:hypothetical protein